MLFLRPGTREHFLEQLARDWPEELERYEQLYSGTRNGYLSKRDAQPVRAQIAALAREHGIGDRRPRPLSPPSEPEQLALRV